MYTFMMLWNEMREKAKASGAEWPSRDSGVTGGITTKLPVPSNIFGDGKRSLGCFLLLNRYIPDAIITYVCLNQIYYQSFRIKRCFGILGIMIQKIKTGLIFGALYIKRKRQLEKKIPDIWNYKTVLYVGARKWRRDFTNKFRKEAYKIDILEIFDKNINSLKKLKWINKIIKGDVRKIDKLLNKKYDIIFWWHGPEHIHKKELKPTLDKLKKLTKHLIVCGCPWGKYQQGEIYGNPWEKHVSHLDVGDFKVHGFKTSTLGKKDVLGNNLLVWWENKQSKVSKNL